MILSCGLLLTLVVILHRYRTIVVGTREYVGPSLLLLLLSSLLPLLILVAELRSTMMLSRVGGLCCDGIGQTCPTILVFMGMPSRRGLL